MVGFPIHYIRLYSIILHPVIFLISMVIPIYSAYIPWKYPKGAITTAPRHCQFGGAGKKSLRTKCTSAAIVRCPGVIFARRPLYVIFLEIMWAIRSTMVDCFLDYMGLYYLDLPALMGIMITHSSEAYSSTSIMICGMKIPQIIQVMDGLFCIEPHGDLGIPNFRKPPYDGKIMEI